MIREPATGRIGGIPDVWGAVDVLNVALIGLGLFAALLLGAL